MKKRIFCTLLALVTCFSLTGCVDRETKHKEKFEKISSELTQCYADFADAYLSYALDLNVSDKDLKSYEKKLDKIYDKAEGLVKELKRYNDRHSDDILFGDVVVTACENSLEEIGEQIEEFHEKNS